MLLKNNLYLKNGWNYVHLFGSCVLTLVGFLFTEYSYLIVALLGILWEVLDDLCRLKKLHFWFLDPRGFDYRDVIMNTIGIISALVIYNFI
jgi:hypothetical protein